LAFLSLLVGLIPPHSLFRISFWPCRRRTPRRARPCGSSKEITQWVGTDGQRYQQTKTTATYEDGREEVDIETRAAPDPAAFPQAQEGHQRRMRRDGQHRREV
jgi:hypothetical protein